jgi:hypothetical protein
MTELAAPQRMPVAAGEGVLYGPAPRYLGAPAWQSDKARESTSCGHAFVFR